MASVQYLFSWSTSLPTELNETQKIFNILTKLRRVCAIIIQKTWRGYSVYKKYYRKRAAIIVLQKYWRGWAVRSKKQQYIAEHEAAVKSRHLDQMATRIQALWRGILARRELKKSNKKSPKDVVAARKQVAKANEDMRDIIRQQFQTNKVQENENEESESRKMVLFILFKCHHLLRTYLREGVYSLHGTTTLSTIETLMSTLPFKNYMNQVRQLYNDAMKVLPHTPVYLFNDKKLQRLEDQLRLRDKSHDLKDVDDIDKNIHDKPFNYSWKIEKPYIRKALSVEKYTKQIFEVGRTVDKTKHICQRDFILDDSFDLSDRFNIPYYIDFWKMHKCHLHNPPDLNPS